MDSSMVIIFPPVYIIESTERCYKCGKRNKVVTYGSGQIKDSSFLKPIRNSFLLNNITSMPDDFVRYITEKNPAYFRDFSKAAGGSYFMNHCECGVKFGDFPMFNEPGGSFCPNDDDDLSLIKISEVPEHLNREAHFICGFTTNDALEFEG
jgi:hypothetical protein